MAEDDRVFISIALKHSNLEQRDLVEFVESQLAMGWTKQQLGERALRKLAEAGRIQLAPSTSDQLEYIAEKVDYLVEQNATAQLAELLPRLERAIEKINNMKGMVAATDVQNVIKADLPDEFMAGIAADFESRQR